MKWLVGYKGRGVVQKKSSTAKKILVKTKVGKSIIVSQPSNGYYIQTGSFSHAPTNDYLSKIIKMGMTYKTESNGNYKVLVGPYSSESDARKSLQKVRKNINKDAFLVSKTETKKEGEIALY